MNYMQRSLPWKWVVGIYYALAILFRPGITCQWLFRRDDLLLFGIIPFLAAIVGLSFYRTPSERTLSWILLALALLGIALSFIPLRSAIGLNQ
jgi:hypothetical protein